MLIQELLMEQKLPKDKRALVASSEHFGSKGENPDGFQSLAKALSALGKKVPEDEVYAYDSDANASPFKKISKALGVVADDIAYGPDAESLISAGFKKVGKSRGDTLYRKEDVILIVSDDTPSMFIF